MIKFACFSPHPPILLPFIGSQQHRKKVKKTIEALHILQKEFQKAKTDYLLISSPHSDWGFNVPLYFLAKNFHGKIKKILIQFNTPKFYFEEGKKIYEKYKNLDISLIASGDLSHCLKKDGPYGFHSDGPKFDKHLIEYLQNKDIKNFLMLDNTFSQAKDCGLGSFCFILGILEASGINWKPKILSYQDVFGVGYLVVNFELL